MWGVSGTSLPLVVAVVVCSMGEWFVVIPTANFPLDSGDIAGVDADASGFSVAADLSSLRCLRFLRSDFPDEVRTIYDLGSTHLCVITAEDQLLESGSYLKHVALLVCLGGLGCVGHVETFGMTAFDTGYFFFLGCIVGTLYW